MVHTSSGAHQVAHVQEMSSKGQAASNKAGAPSPPPTPPSPSSEPLTHHVNHVEQVERARAHHRQLVIGGLGQLSERALWGGSIRLAFVEQ